MKIIVLSSEEFFEKYCSFPTQQETLSLFREIRKKEGPASQEIKFVLAEKLPPTWISQYLKAGAVIRRMGTGSERERIKKGGRIFSEKTAKKYLKKDGAIEVEVKVFLKSGVLSQGLMRKGSEI